MEGEVNYLKFDKSKPHNYLSTTIIRFTDLINLTDRELSTIKTGFKKMIGVRAFDKALTTNQIM